MGTETRRDRAGKDSGGCNVANKDIKSPRGSLLRNNSDRWAACCYESSEGECWRIKVWNPCGPQPWRFESTECDAS